MHEIRTLTLSPSLDIGAAVTRLVPFAKLRSDVAWHEPGGGGINVARAIHRVGGRAFAVFAGDDANGARLEALLAADGVPCQRVPVTGQTRENFSVWVEEPRENYHFVLPGAAMTGAEADRCLEVLLGPASAPAPGFIVASGGLPAGVPTDYFARLARRASDRGCRVVLDTHGDALREALDEPLFMIKPSLSEFYELLGESDYDPSHMPLDEARLRDRARALLSQCRVQVLVVTLGEGGALMATRDECVRAIAPRVRPVSPVGAGDSFLGVAVHALASGEPLREALYQGIAAGASAARTPASALFRAEELDELVERTRELSERTAV